MGAVGAYPFSKKAINAPSPPPPTVISVAPIIRVQPQPTIAPTTNDTGHERPEMNVWQTAATVTVVTSTSPSAERASGRTFWRRSRSEVKNAAE